MTNFDQGLLSPYTLMGASILANRGDIGQGMIQGGLLSTQMAQQQQKAELGRMEMQEMKDKIAQEAEQKKAQQAWMSQHMPDFIGAPQAAIDARMKQKYHTPATHKYGNTVNYAMKDGKVQGYQTSSDGQIRWLPVENPVRPLSFQNMGGNVTAFNPYTGKPVVQQGKTVSPDNLPENVADREKARVTAKAEAEAATEMPNTLMQAEESLALIDNIIQHPGREYATGFSSMLPVIPGTEAQDFVVMLEQLQGKQFLQAFESLKGGGQITEIEGAKAEQSIARMNRAQSEEAFLEAANELKGIIKKGVQRSRKQAGQHPAGNNGGWIIREVK